MVDHGTRAIDKPSDPPSGVFRRPSTDDARWVVVEAGAQFGRVSGDLGTEHTVVLPQWRGESMTGMASRVVERLDAERRAGHDTQRLVLVVSGHAPERLSGRSAIARSLLRHLLDVGGGELELRPDACAEACRHDLLALVERLLPSLRGSPVSVRVAFPDSRRGPGATSRRHGRSALRGRRDLAVSA